MSKLANPNRAYLWLDCDIFRAPAGTTRPDLSTIASEDFNPTGWNYYGGIEAGFTITSDGAATPLRVMNHRNAPYKVSKEPQTDTVAFRSVDDSIANIQTLLQGGELLEFPDGTYEVSPGIYEEFALLLIARDGTDAGGFWSPRWTLSTPATQGGFDGATLAGSEFSAIALSPMKRIYGERPAALDDEGAADLISVVKVDETGAPLAP